MPPLVVASIIGAGAGLMGGGLSANAARKAGDLQSTAAERAAQLQADAANRAAQLQADAAAKTLAFEQQQAGQTRADSIAAQQANFGQWGYHQNTIRPYQGTGLNAENSLAQMLGLPAVNTQLPDLPPPPSFATLPTGSGAPPPATGGSSASPVDGSAASISAFFKSKGVPDTETPYWVSKWPELVARGQQLGDPTYAMTRLSQADIFGKSASPAAQTVGSYAGMPPVAPTPAGTGYTMPFLPTTIGGYGSGAA